MAANPGDRVILEQFGELKSQLGEMNQVLNSLTLRNNQARDSKEFESTTPKLWKHLEESKKKLEALQRFQHLKVAYKVIERGTQLMEKSLSLAAELDRTLLTVQDLAESTATASTEEQSMTFMRQWVIEKLSSEKAAADSSSSSSPEGEVVQGSGSKKTPPEMTFMRQWLIDKLKTESFSARSSSDLNQELVVGGDNLQEDAGSGRSSSMEKLAAESDPSAAEIGIGSSTTLLHPLDPTVAESGGSASKESDSIIK